MTATHDEAIDQLIAHISYRLGPVTDYARPWRVDKLSRLMMRHFPHGHLEACAAAGGRNHRAVEHAIALARAQVRERWEAEHGIGTIWEVVLHDATTAICRVLLDLWWADKRWRSALKDLSAHLAK